MNRFLQIEKVIFGKNNHALCALPNDIEELEQAVTQMGLVDRPVIVLIGGHIFPEHANITNLAAGLKPIESRPDACAHRGAAE